MIFKLVLVQTFQIEKLSPFVNCSIDSRTLQIFWDVRWLGEYISPRKEKDRETIDRFASKASHQANENGIFVYNKSRL